MNLSIPRGIGKIIFILAVTMSSCDEDASPESITINEIGKPIEISYDFNEANSIRDTYFGMDVIIYIPSGIETLENRPLIFTLSTARNTSVTGSMMPIIERYGMIAVSPMDGNSIQFAQFLEAMIETDYVNPDEVYVAGFSYGGGEAFSLAWTHEDKVKGAILLDPTTIFSGREPSENSKLSVCILCQTNRLSRYQPDITTLNKAGVRSKMIGLEDQTHFEIPASKNDNEKFDCFDFVRETY